jgi:hypothetical protein
MRAWNMDRPRASMLRVRRAAQRRRFFVAGFARRRGREARSVLARFGSAAAPSDAGAAASAPR